MKTGKIFENTEIAFALKNDAQLQRAYLLFKMIANAPLVRIGTALANFALKANLPVEGIIRSTVFDHFCGGVNEDDCLPVIESMYTKGVSSVLDYSVEGKANEAEFDSAMEKVLKIIDFAKEKESMPIAVFKPTGFGRFYLYETLSAGKTLTPQEQEEWYRVEARFDKVCKIAKEKDVIVLIDAEESWMQDAADALVTKMMQRYNTEKPIVYNTLQMYRHDRLVFLKKEEALAKANNYFLGYKVVRGAYMEKENERAEKHGYPTPICESKQATDDNFNEAVKYMLDNIERMSLFVGTHNELSSYLVMEQMKDMNLESNDPRVWLGQLYGMSDHISFNLAHHGYNVAKYIPFGPVKDVMPYLIRRAEENTSVAGQTGRELALLQQERKRRKAKA
ncbi:proline dehydrogenase family protein [Oceanihabitans sediminis]|uniref:proline dehydrogenase family protein n=1 Tax=Oceanihabitans sediminis TaxID=1812012 RepID=UPI000930D6D3|nr:proline dehydrogenase family protein [Oceanihabitans sediminis]MDX1277180.1 proline dehydrogenase family protein [Oceanihabitans sediminis]MDX1773598.1 proline dehydrogenase family protein [Oceanihabitans sediminis]